MFFCIVMIKYDEFRFVVIGGWRCEVNSDCSFFIYGEECGW